MPAQLASPPPDPFDACRAVLLVAPVMPNAMRNRVFDLPAPPAHWFAAACDLIVRDVLNPCPAAQRGDVARGRSQPWAATPKDLGELSQNLLKALTSLRVAIDSHTAEHELALEQLVDWRELTLLRKATQHLESAVGGRFEYDHDQAQELAHAMVALVDLDIKHAASVIECLASATAA